MRRIGLVVGLVVALAGLLPDARGIVAAGTGASVSITGVDASRYPDVSVRLHVAYGNGISPAQVASPRFAVSDAGRSASPIATRLLRTSQQGTDVLLLIDTGPSTHGAQINASQTASSSFIGGLGPTDRVAVTFFDQVIHPLTPFTSDKARLNAALARLVVAKGQSRIFDSLYSSIKRLPAGSQRYAVILITDGADVHSRHTMAQDVALARSRRVTVYSVALGTTPVTRVLGGLASGSGGQMFVAGDTAQLQSIYRRLVLVFGHDVELTYRAPLAHHRGDRVSVRVDSTSGGGSAQANYTVPSAPWLRVTGAPSTLGTVEDPRHIAVPIALTSEDNQPRTVAIDVSGWPGMRVDPGTLTVPPFSAGPLRRTLVLSTESGFPGGRRGQIDLRVRPVDSGVHIAGGGVRLAYRVLPSVLRVGAVPADLGSVTDLASGHTLRVAVYSTVFKPAELQVSGGPGVTVVPSVLHLPSARSSSSTTQRLELRVSAAPGGQHGSIALHFRSLTPGVRVRNGDAAIAYYVPTWWESNWKWVVPSVIVALLLLYFFAAVVWERLTASVDTRRRAAIGR